MGGESFVKSWKLVKRMDQFISLMVHKSGASPVEVGNLSTIIYKVLYYIPAGRWGFLNYQLLGVSGHFCSEIQPVQGKECYGSESPQRWKKSDEFSAVFWGKTFPASRVCAELAKNGVAIFGQADKDYKQLKHLLSQVWPQIGSWIMSFRCAINKRWGFLIGTLDPVSFLKTV